MTYLKAGWMNNAWRNDILTRTNTNSTKVNLNVWVIFGLNVVNPGATNVERLNRHRDPDVAVGHVDTECCRKPARGKRGAQHERSPSIKGLVACLAE